jgi:hypothetical protein
MMKQSDMLKIVEIKLTHILEELANTIKFSEINPTVVDEKVGGLARATVQDILEIINEMKSGFADIKDVNEFIKESNGGTP